VSPRAPSLDGRHQNGLPSARERERILQTLLGANSCERRGSGGVRWSGAARLAFIAMDRPMVDAEYHGSVPVHSHAIGQRGSGGASSACLGFLERGAVSGRRARGVYLG
jgi:hypothetical protein